jgi:hypothetical protein
MVPVILKRIRDSYDGQLILIKGPEVAHRYPTTCRPFGDLDILADDAEGAQQALVAAGFEQIGFNDSYYEGLHHLRPLRLPEAPSLHVEIHRRPNWLDWTDPPSNTELFANAVPALCKADGFLGLPLTHHVLVLAAHSWIELPLRRILDLVDVLAVSPHGADRENVQELADLWSMGRVWRTTITAADALVLNGPMPSSLRIWARNLRAVRDRTVLENHMRRWLSGFWALPPYTASKAGIVAVAHDLTPVPGESWTDKLRRVSGAIRRPFRTATERANKLGYDAYRPRFKRK